MESNLKIFSLLSFILFIISCGLPEIEYLGAPDIYESTTLTTEQLAFSWNDSDISSNVLFQGFNIYYRFYDNVNDYISDNDLFDDNISLSYLVNTLKYRITSNLNEQNVPVIEISDHDDGDVYLFDFNQIVLENNDAELVFYTKYGSVNQDSQFLYRNVKSIDDDDEYASFDDLDVSSYSDLSSFSEKLSTDVLMVSIAVASVGISESDFSQIISEPEILGIIQSIPVD